MASVSGSCDPKFAPVRDAFHANFSDRGELGAAVAVYAEGRLVVDLWGGVANHVTQAPWQHDTLTLIFSATKGATALCAHVLAARGLLDLEAPVARYWPEFAAAGKEHLPVSLLLNHQSGLAAIERPLSPETIFDPGLLADTLAQQAPAWSPGTAHGYHAMTFGWLLGELVRRITGQSIGRFFRDAIGDPLGLDFWIGLPGQFESRMSRLRMAPPARRPSRLLTAMFQRDSLSSRAFLNPRSMMMPGQANSPEIHRTEIPSANGITDARSLARLYAILAEGGRLGPVELVDGETLQRLARAESEGDDLVLLAPTRFTAGFMKTTDNRPDSSLLLGPNPQAFGHPGAGGCFGMADPQAGVAIAYVMNQLGQGMLLNERGQAIVDAVYGSL